MPAFVQTPKDEARWSKAKSAVTESKKKGEDSFHDQDWALVNHIYHQMEKADELVDRLKKAKDDIEDDGGDYQDYGDDSAYEQSLLDDPYNEGTDDDEDYEGEEPDYEDVADGVDYDEEEDDAGKWLKDNEDNSKVTKLPPGPAPKIGEEGSATNWKWRGSDKSNPASRISSGELMSGEASPYGEQEESTEAPAKTKSKSKSKSGYSDWAPRSDYSQQESAKMKTLMDQGYSHREAERMAGAHQGPKDMQSALKHTVRASHPSPKMLGELKELAGHWLDNARRHDMVNAEVDKNPDKFAAGKLMQAHEDHTKKFKEDYDNFLNSDDVKGLKGLARHKAVSEWKKGWQEQNPEYKEGHKKVAEAQGAFKQAHEAKRSHKEKLNDLFGRMVGGGMEGETYSAQEGAQHVGGGKNDEGGYTANTFMDPAATFAQNNPEYIKAKQQQVQAQTAAPAKPKAETQVVIRRHANPEQMERLKHVTSQRAAMGIKPKGGQ